MYLHTDICSCSFLPEFRVYFFCTSVLFDGPLPVVDRLLCVGADDSAAGSEDRTGVSGCTDVSGWTGVSGCTDVSGWTGVSGCKRRYRGGVCQAHHR